MKKTVLQRLILHILYGGGIVMRNTIRACFCTGLPVSAAGFALLAAMLSKVSLPLRCYPAAAAVPLLTGCFCAGFAAGRRNRRNGIRCGFSASLMLSALWYAAACLSVQQWRSPLLLCMLLPAGISGGICGVCTRLPLPGRRSHLPGVLRTETALLLRHRPPKKKRAIS